jgi:ribosomal protein S18 acetylase RimI-like enzyme
VLHERRLAFPLTKRLPLDDLSAPDRAWSHAFVDDDDGLTGFAAAGFTPWNKRLTLWHLYIRPDRRRSGIGRALVDRVDSLGRELGARHLWLETSNANPPALRAYRAMGFELTGVDLTLYDATPAEGEVALFMSRRL